MNRKQPIRSLLCLLAATTIIAISGCATGTWFPKWNSPNSGLSGAPVPPQNCGST